MSEARGLTYPNLLGRRTGFKAEPNAVVCLLAGSLSGVRFDRWLEKGSQGSFCWPDPPFRARNGHIPESWETRARYPDSHICAQTSLVAKCVTLSGPVNFPAWVSSSVKTSLIPVLQVPWKSRKRAMWMHVNPSGCWISVMFSTFSFLLPSPSRKPRKRQAWCPTLTKRRTRGRKAAKFGLWLTCVRENVHLLYKHHKSSSVQIF